VPRDERSCSPEEPAQMGGTESRRGARVEAAGEVLPGRPSQSIGGTQSAPRPVQLRDLSGVRILFVDDDEIVRTMAAAMMERLLATATVVSSPLEALRLVREDADRFDVLVTDLTMPEMSGHQLFLQVREVSPALPVMIISGDTLDTKIQACLDLGARGFLPKPFTMARFAQAIHEAYRSRPGPS
jgi:CheY-like chemotaxis protein